MIEWHNYVVGEHATQQAKNILQKNGFQLIEQRGYSELWTKK